MKTHEYKSHLIWDGGNASVPFTYKTYDRSYRIQVDGKPDLAGSSDRLFGGNGERYNPEDLFVAALSSCHLLSYLAICARNGVTVLGYEDDASGTMSIRPDGSGKFEEVTLRPIVTISSDSDEQRARGLHDEAHKQCFIASSVAIPVHHEAQIKVAKPEPAASS
jgi:organic hydroperoxide reductase OsmC/OhrA